MTADLSGTQYEALCNDQNYVVRNVVPKGARYTVDYDYADTTVNPVTEQPPVPNVLGSVSPQGGEGGCGESVQPSDTKDHASSLVAEHQRPPTDKGLAKGERGLRAISSVISSSATMARYLDLDESYISEGTQPNREADSQQGIRAGVGGNQEPKEFVRRPPEQDGEGHSKTSVAREPKERIAPTAEPVGVACPSCGTINHENEQCLICSALAGLKTVCERNRREYHALKSGQRADNTEGCSDTQDSPTTD